MDTATGSGLMEEYDLMKQSKYRVYMSNIDKALKNFEYSSEWADLISALGKLNKVISTNSQYQIIPRRIKISKRLAQCMHPALPSGVHLKALESYDVIFSNIGVDRLASELFIYSAGLFPLLGYSAMNVRPTLLSIYEKYFVPLGEKLRPALSGFLSGVFPGLESGQDHFERTSSLLDKVCAAVKPECFYTCLWECIVTNASVRLPAISYVLDHFDKKRHCGDQKELMGSSVELLVTGLCGCLNDAVILVQRNTLEFLLLAFPLHEMVLAKRDVIKLVKTALNTILRRDMSLNRRLYSWLLGADTSLGKHLEDIGHDRESSDPNSYFEIHSKEVLISAFKLILKSSVTSNPVDLSPYRILISLLDKAEIGQRILDDVLCDIIRTISLCNGNLEVQKSANLLFSTFDPSYIWNYMTTLYRDAVQKKQPNRPSTGTIITSANVKDHVRIDGGPPGAIEVCFLTEFLLETLSLEMYNETTRVYLPKFLLSLIRMLTVYSENMNAPEVGASLRLCVKIVSKVQPMIMSEKVLDLSISTRSNSVTPEGQEAKETPVSLEKSNSDSKIHESSLQVNDSSFARSSSSQGLNKKSKYSKKSKKKSKSYTKLSELDQSVNAAESASNSSSTSSNSNKSGTTVSSGSRTTIATASSTPNLKNEDGTAGESSQEERQSTCSDREDVHSDIVIKVPTQIPPAQLPDCPILEKCIKQYVLFYELYVCRQIFDGTNLDSSGSSGSSSEQVSLQDNLFINPSDSKSLLNDDVFVINALLPELEDAFQSLKMSGGSDSKKLRTILVKSMDNRRDSDVFERWNHVESVPERESFEIEGLLESNEKLKRLVGVRISESLRNALKLACNVLTEMSSFPSYGNDCGLNERCEDVPGWLKALTILGSFIGDLETQLSASQTLIDMVSLLRTNQRPKSSSSGTTFVMMMPLLKLSHVNYLESKTKVFQVLTTMLWNHLDSSRSEARNISVLLYRIHSCLDTRFTESVIISKLLVTPREFGSSDKRNLHGYWAIPTLSTSELIVDPAGFRRFQLLWKLGRDTHHGKEFEKVLFLVLDILTLPANLSIQISASKWLQEALVRGDIGRIMKPLLRILLNESTKRMSIIYTKRYRQDTDTGSEWEKDLVTDGDSFLDKECFAVSSEDGCIRYHMDNVLSKKRSPIRTIQKKIFGVSIGSKSNNSQVVSNYITNDSAKEVGSSAAAVDDGNFTKISVIINPLESELNGKSAAMRNRSNSTGLINVEHVEAGLLPNGVVDKKDFHRSTSDIDEASDGDFDRKKGRLSEGSYSRSTTATDFYDSETVVKRYVEDGPIVEFMSKSGDRFKNRKTYLISSSGGGGGAPDDEGFVSSVSDRNLNYSFTSSAADSDGVTEPVCVAKTAAPAAAEPTSSSAFGGESQRSSGTSKDSSKSGNKDGGDLFGFGRRKAWRNSSKLYPFHTHFLIYESIFNTKQILYTLETLKNILANDSRFFLCLSVTTSVSSSQIRSLLVRHRRNVFGKGFSDGQDESEYQSLYRGCMYLEVIVTILLYYTRSYYQKDEEQKAQPSKDDLNGNSKIQLECIKLMTRIFAELLSIVKDVGKNLANYIADLMEKCKVQKILLYCISSSVNYFTSPQCYTYSDEILVFNDPESSRLYAEAYQIELLNLLLAVIKLEHEIMIQRNDERFNEGIKNVLSSNSPTRPAPENKRIYKYIPNQLVSQQPMFLSSMLSALASEKLKHIHKNWTDMITSCLTCLPLNNLTNIVISIIHQLCANLDRLTRRDRIIYNQCTDYIVAQLEAITVLSHYCLLDSSQQISLANVFNASNNMTSPATNSGQIINSIVNVFLSSSLLNVNQAKTSHQEVAKNAILSHLPRIIITIATLWETSISEFRHVKHQLLEFLSPISLHYGTNFLTAISVAWYERSSESGGSTASSASTNGSDSAEIEGDFFDVMAKSLPQACDNQRLLVKLISGIRIMSVDSFIQTMHQVIKSPPQIYQPPVGLNLEVSALELLFYYLKSVAQTQFSDCWSSLYALLKDCLSLQIPAQFVALSILNEFVQRCPNIPFSDKKDVRDLHDVTSRLVEAISNVAGSCLEQTTWLRRNLSVKEEFSSIESTKDGLLMPSNQHYSIQAQSILAAILAPLLDVAFSSQEKDKVTTIVTGVMYNIVPYLKTHTAKNIPTFHACSNLLASLSTYQYTRKAWRKDALDLLLDATFFQFDSRCLPYWKTILDSLMTCDTTTFRDLMNRLPLAQTGTLNIFTSKEQEYEQRALLLKRLAFVIFCSEVDQYHKYMPEIQEQLANSLRLPQVVPLIQSAVFLCFRVLLLRMSADHVTSLWPIIIAEMVQVFLSIEQELMTDTEEFSQHIRMLSGLDTAWVTNTNNGLYSYGHPHWRMVQLETAKLLELGCVLPATILPHFQMYRWAFVSSQNEHYLKPGSYDDSKSVAFIPHVTRISQLMDFRYTSHSPKPQTNKGSHIMLSCQAINTLQDLYSFFSTLSMRWPSHISYTADTEKDTKACLDEVERVLALDFLERMPQTK